MQLFPDPKILLSIGNIHVTWYAVFILTGALIAYALSLRTLKKWGYDSEMLENFFVPMLLIAIIGARLYYVIFEWERYVADPIRIFYIWEGGLAIHGGLIAGVAFGLWYFRRMKVDGLRVMDAIFPNILIAQALGRWGNFINQEAFGRVVSESYYQGWPSFIKDQMYIGGQYREPTFLYESLANLLGFALITFVYRKHGRRKRGDLAWAYCAWYGAVRFVIESMRSDALMAGGLRIAQLVSLLLVIVGIAGIIGVWDRLFRRFWPFRREKPAVIFDLDGTLIDSRALVDASFVHTMHELKPSYIVTKQDKDAFFGPPLQVSFARYFDSEAEVDHAVDVYRAYNKAHHDELVTLFDGVEEVLRTLKERGCSLGVMSNKKRDIVDMGLSHTGIGRYIDVVLGGDEIDRPKPDPQGILRVCGELRHDHDNVVYVGDSPSDIEAAKNMAAFSVAFVSDASREEALQALSPCALIHEFRELIDIVKEEREWSDTTIW